MKSAVPNYVLEVLKSEFEECSLAMRYNMFLELWKDDFSGVEEKGKS